MTKEVFDACLAQIEAHTTHCGNYKSPGPPFYAANCKLPGQHDGPCDFGTIEEAQRKWDECPSKARVFEGL
jgi:hypothetical protein